MQKYSELYPNIIKLRSQFNLPFDHLNKYPKSSMLSDKLIADSSILNHLEYDDFVKTLNYCFNLILNQENQMKITEFIEISEQNGQKLTNITLSLIHSLTTFNANINLLEQKIKLLRFDKQRAEFLKQKMIDNLYELRKIIYNHELNDITQIQKIDWRFQVEVASKSCKNTFNPNILMHLSLKNQFQQKNQNVLFNMDFANLKNLQYQLNQALKMHRNPKYKVARNSSV